MAPALLTYTYTHTHAYPYPSTRGFAAQNKPKNIKIGGDLVEWNLLSVKDRELIITQPIIHCLKQFWAHLKVHRSHHLNPYPYPPYSNCNQMSYKLLTMQEFQIIYKAS